MRPYYILSDGTIQKLNDSIMIKKDDKNYEIPVENIDSILIFGNSTLSVPVLTILAEKGIPVFIFSYYGKYITSILPENYLQSGFVAVKQVENYLNIENRIKFARAFVYGAALNYNMILKKFKLEAIKIDYEKLKNINSIENLMGWEGNFAENYFERIDTILPEKFKINKRERHPPSNYTNSLLSFTNSLVYSTITSEIFSTHLLPTISYLHEPGYRRNSLSLDVAEIFKPLYSHSVVFSIIRKKRIKDSDFLEKNGIFLNDVGKRKVLEAYDQKLQDTYYVRNLKRKVSYKHLIRLELYKIEKAIIENKKYVPFKPRRW